MVGSGGSHRFEPALRWSLLCALRNVGNSFAVVSAAAAVHRCGSRIARYGRPRGVRRGGKVLRHRAYAYLKALLFIIFPFNAGQEVRPRGGSGYLSGGFTCPFQEYFKMVNIHLVVIHQARSVKVAHAPHHLQVHLGSALVVRLYAKIFRGDGLAGVGVVLFYAQLGAVEGNIGRGCACRTFEQEGRAARPRLVVRKAGFHSGGRASACVGYQPAVGGRHILRRKVIPLPQRFHAAVVVVISVTQVEVGGKGQPPLHGGALRYVLGQAVKGLQVAVIPNA